MLNNVILVSFLVIILTGLLGAFLSQRMKDRCLKDFQGFLVTLLQKSGKRVWGHLLVEPSGVEFKYAGNHWDQDHVETSYILYKEELGMVYMLFRYHDELDQRARAHRLGDIQRSYHPSFTRRLGRTVRNLFSSMKDALTEAGALVVQARTANPALKQVLTSQQKYVTRAQGELMGAMGHAFDPLLERHIGNMVVLEINTPDGTVDEYIGIFKEYSAQFLEVMDVHVREGETSRMCDMIIPRAHAAIRHSAEPVPERARKAEGREPLSTGGGR